MIRNPTQRDVAKLAGVSRSTVSIVVNGQVDGNISISAETRQRVLKAVEELNYEPNVRALALRSGDSKNFSLVVPDVRNPHYWDNVYGVEEAANQAGYNIIFTSHTSNFKDESTVIRSLFRQSADGVILMGGVIDSSPEWRKAFEKMRQRQLPMVEVCDRSIPEHKIDGVASDYRAATGEVMQHLLALGHRRIGFIYGVPHPEAGLDRMEPYQDCLKNAGIAPDPGWVARCGDGIEDGYCAASQLLQSPQRPTALLAINDLLALGVMRAAFDLDLRIPRDLSVVGFDDIFASSYLNPRLTTVSKDAIGMGRAAVELLIERVEHPDRPLQTVQIKARPIFRESTGPAQNP